MNKESRLRRHLSWLERRSARGASTERGGYSYWHLYGFLVGDGEGVTFDVGGTRFSTGGVDRMIGGVGFCTSGFITGGWQFAAASRCEL